MMNHDEIAHRLDRIEDKLDRHLGLVAGHHEAISWIRGYIKANITLLIALSTGVITALFKLFK